MAFTNKENSQMAVLRGGWKDWRANALKNLGSRRTSIKKDKKLKNALNPVGVSAFDC